MKMRISLISILLLPTVLSLNAAQYKVWSVQGDVKRKSDNTTLKRNDLLNTDELLVLEATSKLTLMDDETKLLYPYSTENNAILKVEKIVKKKENKGLLQIVTEIYDATRRVKNKHKTIEYVIPGGLERGSTVSAVDKSIYKIVKSVADSVSSGKTIVSSQEIALLKDINVDACTFIIENHSVKQDYVVNIISVDLTTGQASLCLQFPEFMTERFLVAEANKRLILDDYCFANDPNIKYILFATTDVYDAAHVQTMLRDPFYRQQGNWLYNTYLLSEQVIKH